MFSSLKVVAAAVAIDEELLEELAVTTYFTKDEIKRLHRRFATFDVTNQDRITAEQMFQIPELEFNQMRSRLEAIWAAELASDITFRNFVRMLSPFALNCPREHKFRFAFRVHDADGDGKIGEDDLRALIHALLGATELRRTANMEAGLVEVLPASAFNTATVTPESALPQTSAGDNLIEAIIDQLYDEVDFDDDRTISFEEWVKVVANTDIVSKLTLVP